MIQNEITETVKFKINMKNKSTKNSIEKSYFLASLNSIKLYNYVLARLIETPNMSKTDVSKVVTAYVNESHLKDFLTEVKDGHNRHSLNETAFVLHKDWQAYLKIKYKYNNNERYKESIDNIVADKNYSTVERYGRPSFKRLNFTNVVHLKQNRNKNNDSNDAIRFDDNQRYIIVPLFGKLRIFKNNLKQLEGKQYRLCACKIIKDGNDYFIHQTISYINTKKKFKINKSTIENKHNKKVIVNKHKLISVDLNSSPNKIYATIHKNKYNEFGYSDIYDEIQKLENEIKVLDKIISNRRNKKLTSKNILEKRKRKYNRINNLLTNKMHQQQNIFINEYDFIAIENLNSFAWRDGSSSQSNRLYSYVKPFYFKTQMIHKIKKSKKAALILVDAYLTTKMCNKCNGINYETIKGVQDWTCPTCGVVHERDKNSAINIRNIAVGDIKHPLINNEKLKWKHKDALIFVY